jgi:3-oxoadipate enol-lactonase
VKRFLKERIGPAPHLALDRMGVGELLICLHGIGGNRSNWRDQLPEFGRYFQAVSLDFRGYGDSEDFEGSLDPRDFVEDVLRVINHFRADTAHLMGLSMGGLVAMRFADIYPERLASLTLCDTNLGFSNVSPERRRQFLDLRLAPLLAGAEPRDIAPAVAEALVSPSVTAVAFQRLLDSVAQLHKTSYMKTLEGMSTDAYAFELEKISVPTHVIVGENDPATPPALSRILATRIPGGRLSVVPGAGHLSNIERPSEFTAISLGFLLSLRVTS